jgi:hypothetical protein
MTTKILPRLHGVLSCAIVALLALSACVDLTRPAALTNGGTGGVQVTGGSVSAGGMREDVGPSSTGGTVGSVGGATGSSGGTTSNGGASGSGGASSNGGVPSSSGGTSSRSGGAIGGTTTGSGGTVPSSGGSTTGRGGSTTNGGATTSSGGTVPSSGGTVPSSGGTTTSRGGATANGGTTTSSGGTVPSSGGTVPSSGGTVPSSGGTVPSSGGTTGAGGTKQDAGTPDSASLANLSLNKPVTSISQQVGKEAPKGNDGSMTTSFCPSSGAFPAWWRVDLGAVHPLAKTDISFEKPSSYYKYKIEVSSDDTNWTTVIDQTANTTRNGVTLTDTFSAQARYVRITIIGISTSDWGCFWEFTVWG